MTAALRVSATARALLQPTAARMRCPGTSPVCQATATLRQGLGDQNHTPSLRRCSLNPATAVSRTVFGDDEGAMYEEESEEKEANVVELRSYSGGQKERKHTF